MSFISLQPRLAWRDFSACHWFVFRTHHTCPLALVDWSQIVLPVVNHSDISQWDERGQAWRVRSPQVWLRSTFQNVHTCQLLWYSAAPRKTSVDHWLSPFLLLGPTRREKEIAPVSVAQISDFLPMPRVSSILSQSMPLPLKLWSPIQQQSLGITVLLHIIYIKKYSRSPQTVVSHYSQWYVESSQRTGAGSGMRFPTPQQRSSDHLFPPSGDHKTLTRMCVKCSIVLRSPLVCRPLSFSSLFSCVFIFLPHPLCDSSSRSGSLAQFLCFWVEKQAVCAPGRCGNAGLQHFTGLKSRATPAVITFGRVCACVGLNQSCHND